MSVKFVHESRHVLTEPGDVWHLADLPELDPRCLARLISAAVASSLVEEESDTGRDQYENDDGHDRCAMASGCGRHGGGLSGRCVRGEDRQRVPDYRGEHNEVRVGSCGHVRSVEQPRRGSKRGDDVDGGGDQG
jgi:hypothetical protein